MVDGYSCEDLKLLAEPDPDFMEAMVEIANGSDKGRKDDQTKPDMSLLPLDVLEEVAKVLTFGAKKYSRDNWQHVPDAWNRYTAAMLRHLKAMRTGERIDPDSGLSHAAHMACSALFLVWFDMQKAEVSESNGQEGQTKADSDSQGRRAEPGTRTGP